MFQTRILQGVLLNLTFDPFNWIQGHCIPFTQGGVNMLQTRILQMFFMFFDPDNWCKVTAYPLSIITDR